MYKSLGVCFCWHNHRGHHIFCIYKNIRSIIYLLQKYLHWKIENRINRFTWYEGMDFFMKLKCLSIATWLILVLCKSSNFLKMYLIITNDMQNSPCFPRFWFQSLDCSFQLFFNRPNQLSVAWNLNLPKESIVLAWN